MFLTLAEEAEGLGIPPMFEALKFEALVTVTWTVTCKVDRDADREAHQGDFVNDFIHDLLFYA